jgi:hypothetical protein
MVMRVDSSQDNGAKLDKWLNEISRAAKTKNLIQIFVCLPANTTTHNFIKCHKKQLFKPYINAVKFVDASSLDFVYNIRLIRKQLYAYKESSTAKKYINDKNKTLAFKYKEGFVILSPSRILQTKYTGDPDKIEKIDEAPYVSWLRREDLKMFLNKYNKTIRRAVSEQNKKRFLYIMGKIITAPFILIINILKLLKIWYDEEVLGGIIVIGMIVGIIICFVTWRSGFKKGKAETYEPTKIIAIQTYEEEIIDLRKQIDDISQDYEINVAALRQQQAREINILGTRQSNEIYTLEKNQTIEIANLQKDKESELGFTQTKHENELKETRETYYVKGQVDSRSDIQNQIDSKARVNPLENDWNAPVFSTKR